MSYSFTVSGHKNTQSQEESKEFEESVVRQAKEFVSSLEEVHTASGSFGTLGTVNLMPETPKEE